MTAPAGTFLARVRDGVIQLPLPLKQYCEAQGWTLFHFDVVNADHLTVAPVLRDDSEVLNNDGRLSIPEDLRKQTSLGEQSVMLRLEDGVMHVYLRKVFDTLGFRPR
jgi:hypothetical protein